jgi:hypothetical protein
MSMQSYVSFGGSTSSIFKVNQGVGQGRVISAWLFNLYIDDLLNCLFHSGYGLQLPWGPCPGILLADDTTITSSDPHSLQNLVNIVYEYSLKWKLKYNVSKSAMLVFNADKGLNPNKPYLGNTCIPHKLSITYAGVILYSNNSTLERSKSACEKARMLVNMYHDIGIKYGGLNPIAACRIWNRVILPCALYGCNVWNTLSRKEYEMFESVQRYFCKKIQGFPICTASPVVADALGLISVQCYIDRACLLLFRRLCRLNSSFALKSVFISRITKYECISSHCKGSSKHSSPILNMFTLLEQYTLTDALTDYVLSSETSTKTQWSKLVNDKITATSERLNLHRISIREDLYRYKSLRIPCKELKLWQLSYLYPDSFDIHESITYWLS